MCGRLGLCVYLFCSRGGPSCSSLSHASLQLSTCLNACPCLCAYPVSKLEPNKLYLQPRLSNQPGALNSTSEVFVYL